jgi:glycosyltransferase involved in cell wall biosynthesis
MKKNISIVGTVGLPANYGGWETLADNLVKQLSDKFDITVYCSAPLSDTSIRECNGAHLKYINLKANGIQSIPYDIVSIYHSLKFADYILILGVSGCIFLPFVRFFGNSKVIVNIDGIEWRREKWGFFAKHFLKFSEWMAVKNSHIIVSDNKAIQDYVTNEYGINSRLIPYGGTKGLQSIEVDSKLECQYVFLLKKYALKICRVEPENNIHVILKSFEKIDSIDLVILGNWSNSLYGRKLKEKYSRVENIHLLEQINNKQEILNTFRERALFYIHGHSAGGTNPSLVEAMSLGMDIFAFDVIFNRETTFNKANYFKNSSDLTSQIILYLKQNKRGNGNDMKLLADEKYTWPIVSKQYEDIFLEN